MSKPNQRRLISSGSSFEREIGYSRAVVQGDWVFVSSTTGFDYSSMTISGSVTEQQVAQVGIAGFGEVLSSSVGAWQTWPMKRDTLSDHGYRLPPAIISHAVWLSHRVGVSVRAVEDLLAQRGVTVTYETIRLWCLTVGSVDARRLTRRQDRLDNIRAPRRGLRHPTGSAVLSLACRRSRGCRPR